MGYNIFYRSGLYRHEDLITEQTDEPVGKNDAVYRKCRASLLLIWAAAHAQTYPTNYVFIEDFIGIRNRQISERLDITAINQIFSHWPKVVNCQFQSFLYKPL